MKEKMWLEKAKDEMQIAYDVPFTVRYSGNKVDAYAKGIKSKPYICSCNRCAIENKIRLFLKYYQYDLQIKKRGELLLEILGLPIYFVEKIRDLEIPYGMSWMECLEFKDNLCFACNNSTIPEPRIYLNSPSKFEQRYKKEIDKRFYTYGISYLLPDFYGIYALEGYTPLEKLNLLKPDREQLFKDVLELIKQKKIDMDNSDIKETFNVLYQLSDDKREIIMYWQYYNEEQIVSTYDLVKSLSINEEALNCIRKVLWQRFLKIKQQIREEIYKLIDDTKNEINQGGKDICLRVKINGKYIEFWIFKLNNKIKIIQFDSSVNRNRSKTFQLNQNEVNKALELLNFEELVRKNKEEYHDTFRICWVLSGEYGFEDTIMVKGLKLEKNIIDFICYIKLIIPIDIEI